MNKIDNNIKQAAFTLVELSIVLIIIGLIVGGVLVGQDLIKSAELNATVRQIVSFDTSAATFRLKYGGLPGDLPESRAVAFGLMSSDARNGDSLLGTAANSNNASGEKLLFWHDLSTAGLLDITVSGLTAGMASAAGAAIPNGDIPNIIPSAKIGNGNFIIVYTDGTSNFYEITGITGIAAAGVMTTSTALTPFEAFSLDSKLDNGSPTTGRVVARGGTTANSSPTSGAPGASSNFCITNTTPAEYNSQNTTPLCKIRIKM